MDASDDSTASQRFEWRLLHDAKLVGEGLSATEERRLWELTAGKDGSPILIELHLDDAAL